MCKRFGAGSRGFLCGAELRSRLAPAGHAVYGAHNAPLPAAWQTPARWQLPAGSVRIAPSGPSSSPPAVRVTPHKRPVRQSTANKSRLFG